MRCARAPWLSLGIPILLYLLTNVTAVERKYHRVPLQGDTIRVLWALHETDPELNTAIWPGDKRGGRALRLKTPAPHSPPRHTKDITHWDVKLNQVGVANCHYLAAILSVLSIVSMINLFHLLRSRRFRTTRTLPTGARSSRRRTRRNTT